MSKIPDEKGEISKRKNLLTLYLAYYYYHFRTYISLQIHISFLGPTEALRPISLRSDEDKDCLLNSLPYISPFYVSMIIHVLYSVYTRLITSILNLEEIMKGNQRNHYCITNVYYNFLVDTIAYENFLKFLWLLTTSFFFFFLVNQNKPLYKDQYMIRQACISSPGNSLVVADYNLQAGNDFYFCADILPFLCIDLIKPPFDMQVWKI